MKQGTLINRIVMLLLLIVPIMWFHKHQQKQMGEQG